MSRCLAKAARLARGQGPGPRDGDELIDEEFADGQIPESQLRLDMLGILGQLPAFCRNKTY